MKLKKSIKKVIIVIVIIIALIAIIFIGKKLLPQKENIKEPKVLNTINEYNYVLKDNKSKKYQANFKELSKILSEENVDEVAYVNKITEMFIMDFYSLIDKTSKTDVGGVDIVYPDILENFLKNAENTFYKYVESNIYNNRNQKLPEVEKVTINSTEVIPFTYGTTTDDNAYEVKASWNYTTTDFSDYQQEATLVFIHQDKKLYLVELK